MSERSDGAGAVRSGEKATTLRYNLMDLARTRGDVISLGRGDPDLDTASDIIEDAVAAFADPPTFTEEDQRLGLSSLRHGIADRLERENRMLKGAGAVVLLVLLAVAVMGATAGIPDVVKARAFHVIAKDGTALVKLEDSAGENSGRLGTVTTLNGKGQELVKLSMTTNGEGLDQSGDPPASAGEAAGV
ncbi:MAG: hypothetical protein IIC35_04835 [Gemmatimonadetes bacterium]|nr:hypothetical protein [Gemmatimonadota bacterium]